MRKVNIIGSIIRDGIKQPFNADGWLSGSLFYPDINNVRMYIQVVTCHRNWKQGILADYIEELDDD